MVTRGANLFVRTQTNGPRTYLLIVDNQRVDGKVKQRVLLRLGRLDELQASGQLDSLLQSLGRFSEKLAVLGAHARGDSIATRRPGSVRPRSLNGSGRPARSTQF